MDDEDGEIDPTLFDRLILQVFEEQEDRCGSLRYPLSTQRHALDFIKLVNRKGFPYVLMCQAIEEKQEKFRSWRLGNGNTHIGLVMMKRINKTVQEAMTLPDADADVDIDDLIDDDEEEEEEEVDDDDDDDDDDELELAADDLTTDEDEQHPITSLSSSPTPTTARVDDVSASTDTAADSNKSTSPPTQTSPSAEGGNDVIQDHDNDKTSELLTESEQQQEPSIDSDDVKPTTTGERSDEQSLTTDQLQTEDRDTGRQRDGEETVDEDQSPGNDSKTSSAENQQAAVNVSDNKVEVTSSDTPETNQQVDIPDSNQQVYQASAVDSSESDDVIPIASSSASATETPTVSLSTAAEQAQHAEVDDERRTEQLETTPEDQEKDKESDVKCATAETTDQTETEQNERDVADENDPNDLQSELQVKNDHESDSSTTLTEEDEDDSRCTTEKPPSDHGETTADLDKPSLSMADEELTSQQDAEVGHDEVKVVTEEVKDTEDVKVTYEASAKQLDLLSRLAMLKEKAAQRKAQQTSDNDSTQDSIETTSGEHRDSSRHRDDSSRPDDQSDGLKQLQEHDDPYTSTKTDVDGSSVDTDKDKETDRQVGISTIVADVKQESTEVIGSPGITLSKSEPGQLVSGRDDGRCDTIGSPSVITHDDSVETEARRLSADKNNSVYSAERASLSTTEKSTTKTHAVKRQDISTAQVLNNDINTYTAEAADMNEQLQHIRHSRDTEISREHDELSSATATDTTIDGADQSGRSPALSDTGHGEISRATTAVDVDVQSVPVHSGFENTTDHTGSDRELPAAVTAATDTGSVDSSGSDQLEPTMTLSDISTSVSRRLTESGSETAHLPDNDDTTDNYDSDLDLEFANPDALQLLSDIQALKSSKADGPGYLYIFADHTRRRFKIGASRSPAKRLRQATTFNRDITLLASLPVSRRLAAVAELRQRLLAKDPSDVITACLPGSRDWFTGSDDVMTEQVGQVAAADMTNKV